jgi:fermentation-respiration switch protein FrsA (DUF1100 family)
MATVHLSEERVGGIAAIHAVRADLADRPLPTVVFFHGFNTSSKEITSYFGYMLAMAGLRAVLPEADQHGERFDGDRTARLGQFWQILERCIAELPGWVEHYRGRGLVDGDRVGIGGTSMGGMAVLGAMAAYPWVRAAASYMGSGYFAELSRTLCPPSSGSLPSTLQDLDASSNLERLGNRPLFLWHGERDDVVPFAEAARLRADLGARGLDQQLEFVADPLGVHRITHTSAEAGVRFLAAAL